MYSSQLLYGPSHNLGRFLAHSYWNDCLVSLKSLAFACAQFSEDQAAAFQLGSSPLDFDWVIPKSRFIYFSAFIAVTSPIDSMTPRLPGTMTSKHQMIILPPPCLRLNFQKPLLIQWTSTFNMLREIWWLWDVALGVVWLWGQQDRELSLLQRIIFLIVERWN